MHPRDRKRALVTAAVLVLTAVVLSIVILLVGADIGMMALFAGLVFAGAAVVQLVFEILSKRTGEDVLLEEEGETDRTSPPLLADAEPRAVLESLLGVVGRVGGVKACTLWLEDVATAILRPVASAGPMPLFSTPIPSDEGITGHALETGAATLEALAEVTDADGSRRVWRFAFPIGSESSRGVVTIDIAATEKPRMKDLLALTAPAWPALASGLALHVARQETQIARDLLEATRELTRCMDPAAVFRCALDRAMDMVSAATGSVMLADEEETGLTIALSRGLSENVADAVKVPCDEGIAGWVFAAGKPLLVEDLPSSAQGSQRHGARSTVSVPLVDEDGVIGVLNVGSRISPARFTREHMEAVETFGRQVCIAYRNAQAAESARSLYLSTLKTLAVAMETKDPYSRGGTKRVLDYVVQLGRAIGLGEEDMTGLEMAALFHDMGMMAVGGSVVNEDRPLTIAERGLLKMHPAISAEILAEVPALRNVAPIVYHHHERYDGSGYVGGLSGDAIPIGARILAVVDAFVAMTSDRPYRDAFLIDGAVKELGENAGTQFDPDVVETFVEMLRKDPMMSPDRMDG